MPHVNAYAMDNPYYGFGQMVKLSEGVQGVVIDEGRRGVCIPAIHSFKEGKGNMGRFLDELKTKHETIRFPNLINSKLEGMLQRRGFRKKHEYVPILKTHTDVMVWKRD